MARRLGILPMVLRLVVIGRKLDMLVVDAPGFFSKGVTCPNLNISGKHSSKNDKFASLAIGLRYYSRSDRVFGSIQEAIVSLILTDISRSSRWRMWGIHRTLIGSQLHRSPFDDRRYEAFFNDLLTPARIIIIVSTRDRLTAIINIYCFSSVC